MIGFFEHQYLSFKKNHLKNVIALAMADDEMHEDEKKLIYNMGRKYGLREKQITNLLKNTEAGELYIPEDHNGKMDQLYDLMLMVYADGIVEEREVKFIKQIAQKFEYSDGIVDWLIELFSKQTDLTPQEWDDAKREAIKFTVIKF